MNSLRNYLRQFKILKSIFFGYKVSLFFLKVIFLRIRLLFSKRIVLIPHEGLGDLAVIYSGIIELSKNYQEVHIVCKDWVIESFRQIATFPENVIFIKNGLDKSYSLEKNFLKNIKEIGTLIRLGKHANDPIFKYPNSFYIKMGVNTKVSLKKIPLKPNIHDSVSNIHLPEEFDYVNLINTTHEYELIEKPKKYIEFISPRQLCIVENDISGQEKKAMINLPKDSNLAANISIAHRAKKLHLSDAGIFNIILRTENSLPIKVYTRPHTHSHSRAIYSFPHNGEIHEI